MKYLSVKIGGCLLYFFVFFRITAARWHYANAHGEWPLPGGLMLTVFPVVTVYFLVTLIKLIDRRPRDS
jgi:hypothetical protein